VVAVVAVAFAEMRRPKRFGRKLVMDDAVVGDTGVEDAAGAAGSVRTLRSRSVMSATMSTEGGPR
jgi:hypothetical protein